MRKNCVHSQNRVLKFEVNDVELPRIKENLRPLYGQNGFHIRTLIWLAFIIIERNSDFVTFV